MPASSSRTADGRCGERFANVRRFVALRRVLGATRRQFRARDYKSNVSRLLERVRTVQRGKFDEGPGVGHVLAKCPASWNVHSIKFLRTFICGSQAKSTRDEFDKELFRSFSNFSRVLDYVLINN